VTSTAGFYTLGNNLLYSSKLPSLVDILPPFVDSMPVLSKAFMSKNNIYIMEMKESNHRFHKFLFDSRVWGFNGHYLGPTIEVSPNEIATVSWQNNLSKDIYLLLIIEFMEQAQMFLMFERLSTFMVLKLMTSMMVIQKTGSYQGMKSSISILMNRMMQLYGIMTIQWELRD